MTLALYRLGRAAVRRRRFVLAAWVVAALLVIGVGQASGGIALASLRHPDDQQPDVAYLLRTLGQLWLAGVAIDWGQLHRGERRQRVRLPTYPFERQRHWVEQHQPAAGVAPAVERAMHEPDRQKGRLHTRG